MRVGFLTLAKHARSYSDRAAAFHSDARLSMTNIVMRSRREDGQLVVAVGGDLP